MYEFTGGELFRTAYIFIAKRIGVPDDYLIRLLVQPMPDIIKGLEKVRDDLQKTLTP
jgi:hypothetical protein